jgi:ABC-type transporter Mla MlaB component
MATKDDRPGLLSKVAMFVRNPTKDWSELDQPVDSDANGYDKQALKAMIERKRQNDFVRKREFDQLRKLRDRDPGAMASLERQSFFQNSLPSDLGGRADTLKKIDEIEAQMSRQWWKSKSGGVSQPMSVLPQATASVPAPDLSPSELHPSDSDLSAPFAVTEPVSVRRSDGSDFAEEFTPTQMAADIASVPGMDLLDGGVARSEGTASFSTSRLFAIEDPALEADPELEEGAIRFANSDDTGAENGLLSALRGNGSTPQVAYALAAALLDLYRATDNRPAFEAACHEFAVQLEGARPAWFAVGDPVDPAETASLATAQTASLSTPIWNCPVNLTAQSMESLRTAMVSQPMPWYLGWGELAHVAPDAVALLDGLFGSLCDEAVSLRFDGHDSLVRALRALTPSGNRAVPQTRWQLRLNALRCMGLQDDFELAALDFCVTYGVAPPSWVQARCRFEGTDISLDSALPDEAGPLDPGRAADRMQAPRTLVLEGQILGDATQALSTLHVAAHGERQQLLISCRNLVRVDFAAAGGILNWAAMRQAEGSQVQFLDVHRLVAAFFNVIGINEHAKVVLRPL